MRVVLLGGGGFIGSHLAEWLLQRGTHEVVATDISHAKIRHLLQCKVQRPDWRKETGTGLAAHLGRLIVEHGCELREARQIGFAVGGIVDRVRAVKEIRDREVGAVLLAHLIGALRIGNVELLGPDIVGLEVP